MEPVTENAVRLLGSSRIRGGWLRRLASSEKLMAILEK
jgi:hypothetical protein